jgi:FKBP-type peptidyl-prolyl cis-trans isomerase FklB
VKSSYNDENSAISKEEETRVMDAFHTKMQAEHDEIAARIGQKNLEEGQAFLAENKTKDGVQETASGLQYKVIESGSGTTPTLNSTVETHYEGSLIDGTVFDSSYKRGESISFPVGGVIAGWTEALQLMKEGDVWELFIPSDLAYGAQGTGRMIGPNATLKFKVELIKVK